jgi:protein-tyrosine phosphatase
MIDLHGHYLPGVDDGAASLENSLAMLRHAQDDGIEAVVVTPHACSSLCTFKEFDALRRGWEKLREALAGSGLKIRAYSGAEVYFTSELLSLLRDQSDVLTINNSSYFLLEFPGDFIYAHSKDFIFKILSEGFIPIISHAERNREIQRSPAVLRELVAAGALCQVNAGSLRGDFGNAARQSAFELIQGNLVHVIATDAHDLESRKPELAYVPSLLHGVGADKVDLYLHGIPEAVIADQAIPDIGDPAGLQKRRTFFDFFKKLNS